MLAYPIWLVRLLAWAVKRLVARLRRPPAFVGLLIESPPAEPAPAPLPRWQRLLGRPPLSVAELRERLRRVGADPRVAGILLHLRPLALSGAQVEALRDAVASVRAAGKRVVCWASSYNAATYRVAAACDEILLQPGGELAPLGLYRPYLFLGEALERLGVRADLIQVSPYKTAGDMVMRRGFTPEAREMADWLADAGFTEAVEAVAAGRNLDLESARSLLDRSPFTDQQALAAGAVDAVLAEEEVAGRLGASVVPWESARRRLPRPRPPRPGRVVGLIRVQGTIVDGRSRRAPSLPLRLPLLLEDLCGDLTVVEQARALAMDRRVGAVVLWVDSRGGSATASEAMAAALAHLARRKPLVAAMGSVAASGGYYVTTAARRVFAHPSTITGSIGVLAGKFAAGELLDRLLVGRELVVRGRYSALGHYERPYTEPERRRMLELIDRSYHVFLERVAAARGRPGAEILPVAGGRVWSGRQALERDLVDELGGLEAAAAAARDLAGLSPGAPLVEAGGGRRDLTLEAARSGGALEHVLAALAALDRARVWYLCPLVWGGELPPLS
jgi:protease-4